MIQHKKYLACQAWCTPVANLILVKLGTYIGLSKDFDSFIPGLAVVVAHFFLLLLTLVNVPSVEDVRFKVNVAKSQKLLEKLKLQAVSKKEKDDIEKALATLRSKLVAKSLKDVEHSMAAHSNALQNDTEKS